MTSTDPKMRSITGKLVTNMLTEREDDFTYKVTYVANRTIKDLCKLAAQNGSKFSASELESAITICLLSLNKKFTQLLPWNLDLRITH